MRFVPNSAGIAELGRSEQMAAGLEEIATAVAEEAKASAPYDPAEPPPHFRDSFGVTVSQDQGRAAGIVFTTDPDAPYIELGTGEPGPTPAHHTLANALRAVGLRTGPR